MLSYRNILTQSKGLSQRIFKTPLCLSSNQIARFHSLAGCRLQKPDLSHELTPHHIRPEDQVLQARATPEEQVPSVVESSESKKSVSAVQFTKSDLLKFVLVGLSGGTFGSLVGLGGNIVLIPLLTSVLASISKQRANNNSGESFQFTQKQVNATCLVCVVASGLVGSLTLYQLSKEQNSDETNIDDGQAIKTNTKTKPTANVDWLAAVIIGSLACIVAPFGARIANRMSDYKLKLILSSFMLSIAPASPFIKDYANRFQSQTQQLIESSQPELFPIDMNTASYAAIGTIVGLMTGILGVGGGILMIPALSFIWATHPDKTQKTVIGTSLASMTVPSAVACFAHYRMGNVVTRIAPFLVLGAMMGGLTGGYLGGRVLDEETLKYVFSVTIFLLGIHQLRRTLLLRPTAIRAK